jgi:hypothetical protein
LGNKTPDGASGGYGGFGGGAGGTGEYRNGGNPGPGFGGGDGGNAFQIGGSGGGGGGGGGLGGAIFNDGGTVTITNSTLSSNSVQGGLAGTGAPGASNGMGLGGAIFNHNGTLTLVNSTISGNTADKGSGVYNHADGSAQTATAVINDTITWPPPAPIDSGTVLSSMQLDATSSVPGTLTYTPAAGTVLGVGTDTLLVTLRPTSTALFNYANASVTLTVNQPKSVLTWANPAAVTYGTALGATQLDATASVPGTLTYNPTAGTVLQAGSHTLSVTFTPQDTTQYSTASTSVTITVNQAPLTITANSTSKVYGTTVTPLGTELTSSGLVNGDTVSSVTLTGGGYAATATVASPGPT